MWDINKTQLKEGVKNNQFWKTWEQITNMWIDD